MSIKIGDLTLYTIPEIAEALDVSERTVNNYLKEGKLHGRKFGGRWYVSEASLRAYFEEEPEEEETEPAPGAD